MTGKINRDHFYKLASDIEEERVQAAIALINELSKISGDSGEWKYVLNRLVSGLGSNRSSARLGFSMCLTEAVNLALTTENPIIKNDGDVLALIDSSFSVSAVMQGKFKKGKDERGMLFGKMFALQALLNEPVFQKLFLSGKEISEFALKYLYELIQLALLKNWLREPCLYTFYQTVQKLMSHAASSFVTAIIQMMDENELTLTNEGLAIYLLLLQHDVAKSVISSISLTNNGWKSNMPLMHGNLVTLTQVLLDLHSDDANKSANWAPRLHFVWKILITQLLAEAGSDRQDVKHVSKKRKVAAKEPSTIEFPVFWKAVVDESFFSEKASSERKYLGFLIFQQVLEEIPAEWVENCFSQNLIRSLINQSSNSQRLLHKISQKALQSVVNACTKDSAKLFPILRSLTFGPNGSINFDKLTKSKTVAKLLSLNVNENELKALFKMFEQEALKDGTDNAKIQFYLDTQLHLIRNHKNVINEASMGDEILNPLIKLAFFTKDNEVIIEFAKEKLFSNLSEFTSVKCETRSWQYATLMRIQQFEHDGQDLALQMDDNLKEIMAQGIDCLETLAKVENTPLLSGLECLLSMSLIQLYAGQEEAVSIIEELCAFYDEVEKDTTSLVGVTEILLSLLAQKKSVLKKLSLVVWEQLIPNIGPQELVVLLDVLHARENKQGFRELFEGADEYVEDNGEEDEDENDLSENNKDDLEDEKSSEDDSDSDSDSDSDDDVLDDDKTDDKTEKIDREAASALAMALKLPENILKENGDVDVELLDRPSDDDNENDDSEEEDEESMDDEMMMELDGQLSEIFKRRKEALSSTKTGNQRKLDVQESRESVIAFKHRIVDMLELFIKYSSRVSSDHVNGNKDIDRNQLKDMLLNLIIPFINCIQQTLDKALAEKIAKLMKTRLFKIPSALFRATEVSSQNWFLLKSVHELILTVKPNQYPVVYYSACSSSSLFLSKVLVESKAGEAYGQAYEGIIDVYAETCKKWMQTGKFNVSFFNDFNNWLASKKTAASEPKLKK